MDQSQQGVGRARGRGRGLYQHPTPFHAKDGHIGQQREPWSLTSGPPRPPAPQRPGTMIHGLKHSSSEESAPKGRGGPKMTATSAGSDPTKRTVYPEGRADAIRGNLRPAVPELMLYTRPDEIKSKVGTSGQKITCEANYFRLTKRPEWNIYHYRVDFSPEVLDAIARRRLVSAHRQTLGGYLFDGTQLFLTQMLDGETVEFTSTLRDDETPYIITLRFTGIVSMREAQSLQILNLVLRRAMDGLHLETVGRNKFDPDAAVPVPSLRLQIWPGYITSIRQHEEDILVCAEISHKIMRSDTIWDIINNIRTECRDNTFTTKVEQVLLGATVLTQYNNKTYRIDEITYDVKPSDTFKMKDREISYIDYYKDKYKLNIRDPNQPMLISNLKEKEVRGGQPREVLLVPELCQATGLTDEMRSNFRTMRELSQITKVGPSARIDRLLKFNQRLQQSPESAGQLGAWNLGLDPELVKIPARILPYPDLLFGNGKKAMTTKRADWTPEFRNNSMFKCIDLKRWYIITSVRAKKEAQDFVGALQRAGRGMQFQIANPRIIELQNDAQTAISEEIKKCAGENPQLIMCVVSNNQGDRYATIKKRCYLDYGIPSQVIVAKTITPKDKTKGASGLLSVATKVAIQMNAKLGGLPWMINMPVSGLMTVGYDVCHDPKSKSHSWGAMVATMDLKKNNSEFFTSVNRHKNGEELSNEMGADIVKALKQFETINGCLPERILFFRDGVGDGQIPFVHQHEVANLKSKLKTVYEHRGLPEPPFLYMIVTKRVNTRIFFNHNNPDPGTCVDDIITLPERYDFYLVSQTVREGTVTPTGFNIIHDTIGIPPDRIQQLTFRFTYLYYNWSGTVRVPALCQYAHKLAFLASQSMQASPSGEPTRNLQQTLYFL